MRLPVIACLGAFATPALAGDVTLEFAGDVEDMIVTYACEGSADMDVRYVNAGSASLVVFDWEGERYVASAAISGLGVRYVGDRFVWWTKGEEATLFDELAGADADPLAECVQK